MFRATDIFLLDYFLKQLQISVNIFRKCFIVLYIVCSKETDHERTYKWCDTNLYMVTFRNWSPYDWNLYVCQNMSIIFRSLFLLVSLY